MKLKNITPEAFICHTNNCCPAVFETEKGTYVIVGKKIDASEAGIAERVGDDEWVIEVEKGMIDQLQPVKNAA